jgi:hypothetical protein
MALARWQISAQAGQYCLIWSDTVNNLTSIRLSSSNATGFEVGTETHLYKMVV